MSHTAFIFPGQGSQRTGMLGGAYERFPEVRQTMAEAGDALGYDIWALICDGTQEELNLTEKTQPALLACSVALWRTWRALEGAIPDYMAGHSLGEFSALVCAGALRFDEAVRLVRDRGRFMQTAVPVGEGAMAAIMGLEDALVTEVCGRLSSTNSGQVCPVNFNAPGQVVIAGHRAAVNAAVDALREAGARRAMPLPVSAPFHTPLMHPAGEKLSTILEQIRIDTPRIPVVHNVHGRPENDPGKIRELLVEQIYSPVPWSQCIAWMARAGVRVMIECGPGKVLSGLNRRIDRSLQSVALEEPGEMAATAAEFPEAAS